MEPLIFIIFLASFFITFLTLPRWIKKAKKLGLVLEDMNKTGFPKNVARLGGIIVILGFSLSVLFYIALKTFYFHSEVNVIEIFALLTSVLMLAFIGLMDGVLGWHHGGLRKRYRLILCIFAAVPLMVINAGQSGINIPFFGFIHIGWFYPLILIPLGIVATSTTFNFLAGFNGLEASQGILIITGLSFVAYFTGNTWLSVIGLCMVFSLFAFYIFNRCPAKIFPEDVMTYPVGGLIAITAILGNFERIAVFFFIPYIIEVFLKLRGRLVKQSFGKPNKDGSLELPYDKIYGLEHFSIWVLKKIKNKVYENDVVYFINLMQIVTILLGFLIFKNYIF